jgi:hypothetical protein
MRGSISRTSDNRGFRPFAITINVDTEADLASLWTRMNMSGEVLADAAQRKARSSRLGAFCTSFVNTIGSDPPGKKDVWKLLHAELKASGIRRR